MKIFLGLVRYSKHSETLYIGGKRNKLSIFLAEKAARLEIGRRSWHYGSYWGK